MAFKPVLTHASCVSDIAGFGENQPASEHRECVITKYKLNFGVTSGVCPGCKKVVFSV